MAEPKPLYSVMRQFYKQKMERLLNRRFTRTIDGKKVSVSFSRYGNKHLYSDAERRSKTLQRSDILDMDNIFAGSKYHSSAELSKKRKDNIVKFHYFETKLHGNAVFLNIGEQTYNIKRRDGTTQERKRYIVYSVTDRIRAEKKKKARS